MTATPSPREDLAQTLAASLGLDPDDPSRAALLDTLAGHILEQHSGDLARSLDGLGLDATSPGSPLIETAELEDTAAPAFDETLPAEASPAEELALTVTAEHPRRYETLAELGRGGIGRVVLARDAHLDRDVALKELLSPEAARLGDTPAVSTPVIRFLREARVTGQLEHPGIVPVYELGQREDGALYYTMKVVRGDTLGERLSRAHNLRERMALLPHFGQLCHAMAYAHSRGVIHRDLKPGNVMLGEFGETLVVDWGLAKVRGQRDLRGDALAEDVRSLKQSAPAPEATRAGQLLGTPLYMSPEQAAGDIEQMDTPSDVWSLGVILYELLTGQKAFAATSLIQVLFQVSEGACAPVLEVCPEAPPELAALVDAALRVDPAERMQSAGELAAEIDAYLSGARLQSYRYSSRELLTRWIARNKALVAVIALALLALAAVGASSWAAVIEERDRALAAMTTARNAEQESRQARSVAVSARDDAEALITFMLMELRASLEPIGQLDVLETVVDEIRAYTQGSSAVTAEELDNRARTYATIADIQMARGALDDAKDALDASRTYIREDDASGRAEHALQRARLDLLRGDLDAAQASLSGALQQAHLQTNTRDAQLTQSEIELRLGALALARGQLEEAERRYRAVLTTRRGLLEDHPDDAALPGRVAAVLEHLGEVLLERGEPGEAEATLDEALALREAQLEQTEGDAQVLVALVMTRSQLAQLERRRGALEEARAHAARAVEQLEPRAERDPSNLNWQHLLALLESELAELQSDLGQIEAARLKLEDARVRLHGLHTFNPGNRGWTRSRAVVEGRLGALELEDARLSAARPHLNTALQLTRGLLEADASNAHIRRDLAVAHHRLGHLALASRDLKSAEHHADLALERSEALSGSNPDNLSWLQDVALNQDLLGRVYLEQKRMTAAREALRAARDVYATLREREPGNAAWRAALEDAERALAKLKPRPTRKTPTLLDNKAFKSGGAFGRGPESY